MEDVEEELLSENTPALSKLPSFDCEAEGLKYLAGYIAAKHIKDYPELGQKTCDMPIFPKSSAPWITALSRGGLVVPSDDFLAKIYAMEKVFHGMHGSEISPEKFIIKKLSARLADKFPSVPEVVVKKYAKTRTFIRLKFLNCKLAIAKGEAIAERKRKQLSQFTK